jgi:hypothetical protein
MLWPDKVIGVVTTNPQANKCPLCCSRITHLHLGSQMGEVEFDVSICGYCGGLMVCDPETMSLRALTPAERKRLPDHPKAERIKKWQAMVTKYLIG